jgi:hypothetical protein
MIEPPGRSLELLIAATKVQIIRSDLTDHYRKAAVRWH